MLAVDYDCHATDIGVREETLEGAGEDGLPADCAELLGDAVPGAGPAARCHDHGRDV
jgi:hypothetical protein